MHNPWVTTDTSFKEYEQMRISMEPIMYQFGVDVMFNGHVHSYERSNPIYNYALNPCGMVHIVVGDAGNSEGLSGLNYYTNTFDHRARSALLQTAWGHGVRATWLQWAAQALCVVAILLLLTWVCANGIHNSSEQGHRSALIHLCMGLFGQPCCQTGNSCTSCPVQLCCQRIGSMGLAHEPLAAPQPHQLDVFLNLHKGSNGSSKAIAPWVLTGPCERHLPVCHAACARKHAGKSSSDADSCVQHTVYEDSSLVFPATPTLNTGGCPYRGLTYRPSDMKSLNPNVECAPVMPYTQKPMTSLS